MKRIDEAVTVTENKTPYPWRDILALAQRDNNTKRRFLLVNHKQGKHLPVAPAEALDLFARLGRQAAAICQGRRTVVIGFAETATAIGAAVAAALGADTPYLQTTREVLDHGLVNLLEFREEHSHAVQQSLYCCQPAQWLGQAEVILFVEDEISSGQTVLNFVQALRQLPDLNPAAAFAVVSLVNGLDAEAQARFSQQGIVCSYLLKCGYDLTLDPYPHLAEAAAWTPSTAGEQPPALVLPGWQDSRQGVIIGPYQAACQALGRQVAAALAQRGCQGGDILVLGAEECMYPALLAAEAVQAAWPAARVVSHATTRSPIKASAQPDYPLANRSRLHSLYEWEREIFVYNLTAYDQVVIVHDAQRPEPAAMAELAAALRHFGSSNILAVRWGQ